MKDKLPKEYKMNIDSRNGPICIILSTETTNSQHKEKMNDVHGLYWLQNATNIPLIILMKKIIKIPNQKITSNINFKDYSSLDRNPNIQGTTNNDRN